MTLITDSAFSVHNPDRFQLAVQKPDNEVYIILRSPVAFLLTVSWLAAGLRIICAGLDNDPEKIGIHMHVLRSPEVLAKASMVTPFHYNAPLMLLVCRDLNAVWKQPGDRMFYNYNSGEQDASIVATTMMYEAEELGIHNVWLRGFDALFRTWLCQKTD